MNRLRGLEVSALGGVEHRTAEPPQCRRPRRDRNGGRPLRNGGALANRSRKGDLAEALGFAHARGVVHRDLKPSNIFLVGGRIEDVKVLDFGIAQIDAASLITRTGMLIGTPAYMAPEQARGGERLSTRADVFSLGCVLFECLTGEQAFGGEHLMAVLARILFDTPPRMRAKRPEIPEALDALLDRMLAKSPEDRPQDGDAVALALRALGELSSSAVRAPTEDGPPAAALTGSEQRAVAVILVSAPAPRDEPTEERRTKDTLVADPNEALRREATLHGGHFEPLMNGSAAVILASTTMATDLAAQAARCALALRVQANRGLAWSSSGTSKRAAPRWQSGLAGEIRCGQGRPSACSANACGVRVASWRASPSRRGEGRHRNLDRLVEIHHRTSAPMPSPTRALPP